jgi:hypothetical protein
LVGHSPSTRRQWHWPRIVPHSRDASDSRETTRLWTASVCFNAINWWQIGQLTPWSGHRNATNRRWTSGQRLAWWCYRQHLSHSCHFHDFRAWSSSSFGLVFTSCLFTHNRLPSKFPPFQ